MVNTFTKLNYPLNSYADFDIYSNEPPRNDDYKIGNNEDSYDWSIIYLGG